ncbi:MAG TPA: NirD/YgiW/YdeI family stress tolerance protein [Geopsychrobacteraceae bacterium]|nr:NirD/YgiW/YdeI family stress tolerance protein [Geopsychrobacteraceae bacterium]
MIEKRLLSISLFIAMIFFATSALAVNPYVQPDNTWITISGTVKNVTADSFILDYGSGTIIVEMDDGDRDADGYKLLNGDKVTVNGKIDDDFFEKTSIEASSVYVESIGTFFFASAEDEEDYNVNLVTPIIVSTSVVQGVVTKVENHGFTINDGEKSLDIDVSEMAFDPLDDKGYLKIDVGDLVRVTGTMDDRFFTDRELVASSAVEIIDFID